MDLRDAFRSEMGTVARQSTLYLLGTLFTLGGGLFFKIYTARVLGAEGLGQFALAMSVVGLGGMFVHLGLPRAMVRFVPGYLARGDAAAVRALAGWSSAIIAGLSCAAGLAVALLREPIATTVFGKPELAPVLGVVAVMLPLGNLGFLLDQLLVGFRRTALSKSINSFVGFSLMIACTVLLVALGWGLWGYIAATILSSAVTLAIMTACAWRLLPARPAGTRRAGISREVASYSGYMLGMGVIDYASGGLDNLLLGVSVAVGQLGIYSVAVVAASFVPMLLATVNTIFAPFIAEMQARQEPALLERMLQALAKWTTALTLPLFLVLVVFADEFLRIFGSEFAAGASVLALLAVAQMVNVVTGSCGQMLLMSGQHREVLHVKIGLAVLAPLLYVLLIPALGMLGAAVVGMTVAVVSNLSWVGLVWRHLHMLPYNRSSVRLVPPALLATAAVVGVHLGLAPLLSRPAWLAILPALALGYLVFGVVWLWLGLDADDRYLLQVARARVRRMGR